jgi:hypothetical protein
MSEKCPAGLLEAGGGRREAGGGRLEAGGWKLGTGGSYPNLTPHE